MATTTTAPATAEVRFTIIDDGRASQVDARVVRGRVGLSADALQTALGEAVRIAFAMRYGQPAIGPAIDALRAAGADRILVAPLYPQYCAATTATVVDAVGAHLKTLRWQPALRFLPPYHDDEAYLAALRTSIEAGLRAPLTA